MIENAPTSGKTLFLAISARRRQPCSIKTSRVKLIFGGRAEANDGLGFRNIGKGFMSHHVVKMIEKAFIFRERARRKEAHVTDYLGDARVQCFGARGLIDQPQASARLASMNRPVSSNTKSRGGKAQARSGDIVLPPNFTSGSTEVGILAGIGQIACETQSKTAAETRARILATTGCGNVHRRCKPA